jgi:hypothetical protein
VLPHRHTIGYTPIACLVTALLAAAAGLGSVLTPGIAQLSRSPLAAPAPRVSFDPSRFILNALLVPALDADAVPLRWVDPRPALRCGPDTTVRVNREPLLAGASVPDTPFELEWHTDGCRPFGARGPRFDGWVRLTVFREDWGFSAIVEPSVLRVASMDAEITVVERGSASTPQLVEADDLEELTIQFDPRHPEGAPN